MNTTLLLHSLNPFIKLTQSLAKQATAENPDVNYIYSIAYSYDYITLSIFRIDSTDSENLHLRVWFEVREEIIQLKEIHHEDLARVKNISDSIKKNDQLQHIHVHTVQTDEEWLHPETVEYLCIADRIAALGMYVYPGDTYRPGFYSSIEVTASHIKLSQSNHMHSRSLIHKNNYCLRDLTCIIPLNPMDVIDKTFHDTYVIGNMRIEFSDRSSPNNRNAGNAIAEQIEKEMQAYFK